MNALWLDDVNDADDDAKSFIIFVRWSFASYNAMNRARSRTIVVLVRANEPKKCSES